ncbi:MAG: hypothetical protein ACQCN6_12850 [Candidatus Bathyarchaeia archaeon]|jgi:hypothetical protein
MYDIERIAIEIASAIICFILVKFMIKPFQLTGETRHLFLGLGFGLLGTSYAFSAMSFALEALHSWSPFFISWFWVELLLRAFAFLFLAITYYFSRLEKKTKLLWNTTFVILVTLLAILILSAIIFPQLPWSSYILINIYVRFFSLICLLYISIQSLRSHLEQADPKTLLVPLGYILLGISTYSSLIGAVDLTLFPLFGALVLRLLGLGVLLFVCYKTFYHSEERE